MIVTLETFLRSRMRLPIRFLQYWNRRSATLSVSARAAKRLSTSVPGNSISRPCGTCCGATAQISRTRALLREAVAIDPNFATAHAAIALSCNWLIAHGITEDADETRAEQLRQATVAVNLDARDPLAHSAMGLALTEIGEHDKAVAALSTATSLNPNSSFGQWCFGYVLNRADRYAEALERFDLALRLSPRDPAAWSFLALRAAALYQLGDYAAAAASAREATRAQVVDLVWPHVHLAASLGQLDRPDEAAHAIAELCRLRPGLTISQFRAWPLNRHRPIEACERIVGGLRKAGLPE